MIKQYVYGFVLLLFVAVCSLAGYYKWKTDKQALDVQIAKTALRDAKAENESLKEQNKQASNEIKALKEANKTRDDELERLRKSKEISDAKLRDAIKNNRVWSDTPLPDGVRNALQNKNN